MRGTAAHNRQMDGDTAWMDRAACVGLDPRLFFPPRGDSGDGQAAKAVCARCPVREDCLAFALDNKEMFGVWGGLSERARRRIRRARAKATASG